jgi:SAM-dependent methyltransferase
MLQLPRLRQQGVKMLPLPPMPAPLAEMRSGLALHWLVENAEFQTVMDIGSGNGEYADELESRGKVVTRFDFGKSRAYDAETQLDKTVIGDFLTYEFERKFDCLWAAHVLEHTPEPQVFLRQMRKACKPDGWLAITVPPAKGELVGGHLTLWTPGMLLYHLILAGIDCSAAKVMRYGYSISVIVRNKSHDIDLSTLAWDLEDITRLAAAFPPGVRPRIDGDTIGDVYADAKINFIR